MSDNKTKLVVTRDMGPTAMEILKGRSDLELVVWEKEEACDRAWILENVKGAEGIVLFGHDGKVDQEFLDAAGPQLKVISTCSVGYDHFDQAALKNTSIRTGYTPDVLTDAVADLTMLLILLAGRNGGESISLVQNGQWPSFNWSPFALTGPQLSPSPSAGSPHRTVGFIGFGRIAQAVLARLAGFGITHCLFTSNPSSTPRPDIEVDLAARLRLLKVAHAPLEEIAQEADVVVVLAPGGKDTYHVVDEKFLRQMKKTAILVNAARGTLVDSEALAKALKEKWIWAAALDVVEGEPNVGADHPLVKEPRCVILPHIGSATTEARIGMTTTAVNNALAVLDGKDMPAELKFK